MTHPWQHVETLTEHTRRVSALSLAVAALAEKMAAVSGNEMDLTVMSTLCEVLEDEVDRALEVGAASEAIMRDLNRPADPSTGCGLGTEPHAG